MVPSTSIAQPPLMQDLHFHHPEVALLFQRSMRITPEEVQDLLALPNDTLAADLRAILRHAVERFDRYQAYAEEHGWHWDTMSAPFHAITLLSELPGRENLEAVLDFLAAEEEVLDYHLGDQLTEYMWEPIAKLADAGMDLVTAFVRSAGNLDTARVMVAHGVAHIAHTWPTRLPEVEAWITEQLTYFTELPNQDPELHIYVVDSIILDAIQLELRALLPLIETLYSQDRASELHNGSIETVREAFAHPQPFIRDQVLPISDRYARHLRFQEMTERNQAKEEERKARSVLDTSPEPLPLDDLHFHHPEVAILFQRSMRIAPEEVQDLLALPHDTLAADLRAILWHAVERFDAYQQLEEEHGWQWDAMSAPMHAVLLLAELPGRDNLDAILGFVASDDEPLRFHLSDLLTEMMWEPIAKLAIGHFDRIAEFVRTPCPDVFARVAAAEAMNRVAWTWPEHTSAVSQWYKEQLVHFAQLPDGDPALDETLVAALIADCMDQEWTDLLPVMEPLFTLDRVDTGYCGDWSDVQQQMLKPRFRAKRETVRPLAACYADMLSIEENHRQRQAEVEDMPLLVPERELWDHPFPDGSLQPVAPHVRESPKVGRNEPCPCGSGKKYKKCCAG